MIQLVRSLKKPELIPISNDKSALRQFLICDTRLFLSYFGSAEDSHPNIFILQNDIITVETQSPWLEIF